MSGSQKSQILVHLAGALAGSDHPEHLAEKLPPKEERPPLEEEHPVEKPKSLAKRKAKAPGPAEGKEAPDPVKESEGPSGPSTEDLRVAVSKKIAKYRKEIMAKMSEIGAKNLSSVPEGNRKELLDYINSLD